MSIDPAQERLRPPVNERGLSARVSYWLDIERLNRAAPAPNGPEPGCPQPYVFRKHATGAENRRALDHLSQP